MKKAINILLTAFLAVTLAGCSSSSDPTPAPTSGTSEKETAEPEPTPEPSAPAQASSTYEVYKLGDTINTYGDITFTLTEVGVSETISREPDDTFLLPAEDGFKSGDAYRYLYYKIDFKYTGNKPAKQYDLFYMQGYAQPIQISSGFFSASVFRPVGTEEWIVGGYSSDAAQIIRPLMELKLGRDYEFAPSDQMYEARGMIVFPKEELEKGTVRLNLNNYVFEIDL